jgi:hypothetical protein
MAEAEEDLLGKADALMARHRPGHSGSGSYTEIPVLDEVVDPATVSDDLPVLTEMVAFGVIEPVPAEPQTAQQARSEALTESMRATLLAALQPEIDMLIEERLKQSLEPLVERLFEDLRGELQLIARDTLSAAINSAVERELRRRGSGG